MAVVVIDTIKPKNNGTFPVVEAADVKVTDDKRLDAALNDKANQSDVTALQTAVAGKASQADLNALSTTVAGKASQSDLNALSVTVESKASASALATTNAAVAEKANQSSLEALQDALAETNTNLGDKADKSTTTNLQAQIDELITPVTQDAEVQNARVGADGETYTTLKQRLDTESIDLDSRINQVESVVGISDTVTSKTGTLPIIFTSNGNNLSNYSIIGNTGGVGDATNNLFNYNDCTLKKWISSTGVVTNNDEGFLYNQHITVTAGQKYTYKSKDSVNKLSAAIFAFYDSDNNFIRRENSSGEEITVTAQEGDAYFIFGGGVPTLATTDKIESCKVMLNKGASSLPFEIYGYVIPVNCGGTITNIFVNSPLGLSDTLTYETSQITIPTVEGANTLTIDTTVQPSTVTIEYTDLYGISSNTKTGAPPIIFTSTGSNLLDYTINGATGGVGIPTDNLFNYDDVTLGKWISGSGAVTDNNQGFLFNTHIPVTTGTSLTYKSTDSTNKLTGAEFVFYDSSDNFVRRENSNGAQLTVTAQEGEAYVVFGGATAAATSTKQLISICKVMVNIGDTIKDFEPYGYKIPIICGGETNNIYIDEALGQGDSITYAEAQVDIPTVDGSNTFTVGTTVQPSTVTIKYAEIRRGGLVGLNRKVESIDNNISRTYTKVPKNGKYMHYADNTWVESDTDTSISHGTTDFIEVTPNSKITISAFWRGSNSYATYALYDSAMIPIHYGSPVNDGLSVDVNEPFVADYEINIPTNATYIKVVAWKAQAISELPFYIMLNSEVEYDDFDRILRVSELSRNNDYDLFVFAGQSNMMGASVLPPKDNKKCYYSYEYLYNPKRLGAETGEFVDSENSPGEWSYKNIATAYASGNVDEEGRSKTTNYGDSTYFVAAMSNMLDATEHTTSPFASYSESTCQKGCNFATSFAREYASYGYPTVYASMAKGAVSIEYYLDTNVKAFFAEKFENMLADFSTIFPNGKIKSKNFVWCQGESNSSTSKASYKSKLGQVWTWAQSLGFERMFIVRVGYWGDLSIKNILQAQEEFCAENANCYMATRAMSYMYFPNLNVNDWYIKPPQDQYLMCRDSFYGYTNNHINEKGHDLVGKRLAKSVDAVLNKGGVPILEAENVSGLV